MNWNLEEAISYYRKLGAPGEQSALIGLLKEIQLESGGSVPGYIPGLVAAEYDIKESFVLAIIKRIPSLRLGENHCLELCAGPNCSKHAALAAYSEKIHASSGEIFRLKFVPCMRMCGKGPNLKWDGKLYHKADESLLQALLNDAGIEI